MERPTKENYDGKVYYDVLVKMFLASDRNECMAGHSKWNNIKNRKGAVDAKKGKIFGQVAKLIRIAVKEGKSDNPKNNASLRLALEKARAANMPKDKIQKAIDRGSGKSSSGAELQEQTYEGFGPGGVGFLVMAITDNSNRTSSELKFVFSRASGSLGSPGSAMYLFSRMVDGNLEVTIPLEVNASAFADIEALSDQLLSLDDVEEVVHNAVLTSE